jgi:hypothetical protein
VSRRPTPQNDEDFSQATLKPFGEKAHRFAFRAPRDDKRINILTGAVRSSKTWAMVPKMLALCRYKVGGRRLITGASKMTIYNNVLSDLFDVVGSRNYSYNQSSGALRLFDTSWRCLGAKDEGSERYIRGATVGICYCDELSLMPSSFYNMLATRMSPSGARLYATTNPDSPYHWLKTDVIDNKTLLDSGNLFVEHFGLDDNPNIDQEFKEHLRRSYTGIFRRRFIDGDWVLAQGSVYRDVLTDDIFYTNATRPIGLLSRGGHRERWLAVDDGVVNPFVVIDCIDTGRIVYWDRELYFDSRKEMRQLTDGDKADLIRKFITDGNGGQQVDPRWWPGIIIDPSAASLKAELRKRGHYVVDARNEVEDGIRRVSTMLNLKKIRINSEGCPNGVIEMHTYAWDEKRAESGKEQPLKVHDHYPDAGRYHTETRIDDYRLAA